MLSECFICIVRILWRCYTTIIRGSHDRIWIYFYLTQITSCYYVDISHLIGLESKGLTALLIKTNFSKLMKLSITRRNELDGACLLDIFILIWLLSNWDGNMDSIWGTLNRSNFAEEGTPVLVVPFPRDSFIPLEVYGRQRPLHHGLPCPHCQLFMFNGIGTGKHSLKRPERRVSQSQIHSTRTSSRFHVSSLLINAIL